MMTDIQRAGPARLAVLGAGVMGVGIATLAQGHGVPVVLVDIREEALERAVGTIPRQLRLARLHGKLPREAAPAGLRTTTSLADVADATAVVEAVTELPDAKAKVLAEVSALIAPGTPVVSNTSAIPIDELAGHAARPQDVVGAHFMNPPYLIRTVEVIRGPRTSDAALDAVLSLLAALDRESVVVGDGPGFVINRILQRVINEAARVVEEGVASPESVDALFKGCLGHSTGPLATGDLIGLDNVVDSLRVLRDRTGDAGYEPCDLLLAKVRAGDFGRKTGRGFYAYDSLHS
ncbi:3-hydroxyacyl-CoA dehydrogenase family protein [Streptomyces sp. P1-3]|uniref:3-hydroxyacyl-CoA dehydrogenase family protein n=1 Tax=Streptomyces sp. P1-3 TaxID=3421658 RepID=UPI003D364A14